MKREFSAGGLVFKRLKTQDSKFNILWLVRRPKPNEGYRGNLGWSFPKGWIDEGEKAEQAAVREVREEGGVEAKIIKKLSTVKIFFTDQNGEKVMKFITYFVMEWMRDLPEGPGWETEEVKWADLADGLELLAFGSEKKLLKEAAAVV